MQARANFFERKIIATLRKGWRTVLTFHNKKIATSPDFIGCF